MNNPLSDKDFMNFPYLNIFYSFASFLFKDLLPLENRNFLYAATSLQIFHFMDFLMKKCLPYKRLSKAFFIMEKCPNQYGKKKSDQR